MMCEAMPLTAQSLNLFNNQMPLTQSGVSFLPQFSSPYKEGVSYTKQEQLEALLKGSQTLPAYQKRIPQCQKCGQHNRKSRLKGHKRTCPFKDCSCPKCQVVTERQKLMADQIKIRRRQRKDTILSLTRDNLKMLNAVPQPYINNLTNLNMLCKQIAAQQPIDMQHDLENQQPMQFNQTSPTTSLVSFQQQNINTSSAFSPASKIDSPQLVSSPLSTIGTEISLSPQQFSCSNSFDLGLLSNQISASQQQQQLLSAALMQQPDLKSQITPPATSNAGFDLTPPQSAGLAAPVPVNPTQNTSLNYDNLLALTQLLAAPQQPVVSAAAPPSLLSFVQPQQSNLQDLLSLVTLLQQFQGQQLSPPPTEKTPMHKPNGFVDVCSV